MSERLLPVFLLAAESSDGRGTYGNTVLLVSIFFVLLALVLLVLLLFLYKLTLAVSRMDRRMEQLARHLRDLNLYEIPGDDIDPVFAPATEAEGSSATDALRPPPAKEADSEIGGTTPTSSMPPQET